MGYKSHSIECLASGEDWILQVAIKPDHCNLLKHILQYSIVGFAKPVGLYYIGKDTSLILLAENCDYKEYIYVYNTVFSKHY